jgi:hypothetical protein
VCVGTISVRTSNYIRQDNSREADSRLPVASDLMSPAATICCVPNLGLSKMELKFY